MATTRSSLRRRAAGAALAFGLALSTGFASLVTAHGPDPVLGGALFAQNQALLFDWRSGAAPPAALKTAIRAAAADATATRASKAATFAYDAAGSNPIGYGTGATCGPNGIACFTRSAPTGFTMWFREQGHVFDWGSLKWCQSYTNPPNGCFDVETIALDEFGHVEILNHHVNYADERDYDDAVVQTISRAKPAAGWNMHRFGRCDVATLQREYDVPNTTAKYSTCLDLSTTLTIAACTGVDRLQRHDDPHRDAQGRRSRRVRTPGRQRRLGPDREPPAARRRDDDLDLGRDDGGRRFGHVQPRDPAPIGHRVPGGLQDADRRGPQR